MKKACVFLMVLCLCITSLPGLAMSVTELTEEELASYYYEYWVYGVDAVLMIPVQSQAELQIDMPELKLLLIQAAACPDTLLGFYAIYNPEISKVDLSAANEDTLLDVIECVTPRVKTTTHEAPFELYDGVYAMLVYEKALEGMYAHLIAFYGDWLFNMMAVPLKTKNAVSKDGLALQKKLLGTAFSLRDTMQYTRNYALEGTPFTVTVGENSRISIPKDEPEYKQLYITYPGTQQAAMTIILMHDEALEGHTVATLDPQITEQLVAFSTPGDVDEASIEGIEVGKDKMPAFRFGLSGNVQYHYALAVNNGWSMTISYFEYETFDTATLEAQQMALLESFLGTK